MVSDKANQRCPEYSLKQQENPAFLLYDESPRVSFLLIVSGFLLRLKLLQDTNWEY
jgi:hypothetical protein